MDVGGEFGHWRGVDDEVTRNRARTTKAVLGNQSQRVRDGHVCVVFVDVDGVGNRRPRGAVAKVPSVVLRTVDGGRHEGEGRASLGLVQRHAENRFREYAYCGSCGVVASVFRERNQLHGLRFLKPGRVREHVARFERIGSGAVLKQPQVVRGALACVGEHRRKGRAGWGRHGESGVCTGKRAHVHDGFRVAPKFIHRGGHHVVQNRHRGSPEVDVRHGQAVAAIVVAKFPHNGAVTRRLEIHVERRASLFEVAADREGGRRVDRHLFAVGGGAMGVADDKRHGVVARACIRVEWVPIRGCASIPK